MLKGKYYLLDYDRFYDKIQVRLVNIKEITYLTKSLQVVKTFENPNRICQMRIVYDRLFRDFTINEFYIHCALSNIVVNTDELFIIKTEYICRGQYNIIIFAKNLHDILKHFTLFAYTHLSNKEIPTKASLKGDKYIIKSHLSDLKDEIKKILFTKEYKEILP